MFIYDIWRLIWTFLEPIDCVRTIHTGHRRLFEDWFTSKTKSCNNEQRAIIHNILFANKNKHHLVIGSAGVGKTLILKILTDIKRELQHNVTIGAFTGLAAKNAGGETLHRIFPLGWGNRDPLTGYILVDEVSMVSLPMFIKMVEHQEGTNFKFVFFGDFLQLPPIEEKGFLFEHPSFFELFCVHQLKKVMRQVELDFITLLHHISWNQFPPSVVRFILHKIYCYNQLTKEQRETKLHLYYDRKHVKEHNDKCFTQIPQPTHWHTIDLQGIVKKCLYYKRRKQRVITEEDAAICQQLQQEYHIEPACLKIGCWIMFTHNLYDIEDQQKNNVPIRNGTRALVTEIDSHGVKVWMEEYGFVRVDRQTIPLYWKQKKTKKCKIGCTVRFQGRLWIVKSFVQVGLMTQIEIQRISCTEIVYEHQLDVLERTIHYFFELECLPCTLSYALTIHKSQGMTLDEIVLHLHSLPNCHLFYVALSRCRTKKGVYIDGTFAKPRTGVHPAIQNFYAHI